VVVGQEPDEEDEDGNTVPGADIVEYREYFTYLKAWRPHLVDSRFFDNPIAYQNPTRDPAPSLESWTSRDVVLGPAVSADARDLEGALLPWAPRHLLGTDVSALPATALALGFTEADHRYFYSRVPEDGYAEGVAKAAAAYLVDGVVDASALARGTGIEALLGRAGLDWIVKGTCRAGDIRVSFDARAVPRRLGAVGRVEGARLRPHVYAASRPSVRHHDWATFWPTAWLFGPAASESSGGGPAAGGRVIARPGLWTSHRELLDAVAAEASSRARTRRALGCFAMLLAVWFGGPNVPGLLFVAGRTTPLASVPVAAFSLTALVVGGLWIRLGAPADGARALAAAAIAVGVLAWVDGGCRNEKGRRRKRA
jgi:hypothetical protein